MKDKFESTLGFKPLPNRTYNFKNVDAWLEDKRAFEGAEGLWRIHNNLYDMSSFIDIHPGGKFWLEITKGTDITEAFETHHISTTPEDILKKYYVRKAKTARYSPFTFEEDGFYRTLKRNVREAIKDVPKDSHKAVERMTDGLLIGSFIFAVLSCIFWSYTIAAVSGFMLSSTLIAAHSYSHKRHTFRVHYTEIAMMSSRQWRIMHVLGHHLFPNTVADIQAYFTEPMAYFYPHSKSLWARYGSWAYVPFFCWPNTFFFILITRMYQWMFLGYDNVKKADLFAFTVPLAMYLFGGQPFFSTIGMWMVIIMFHGFCFGLIGTATTHAHPDIFTDGDATRAENEMDWGIFQLDTVSDRHDVTGNLFLVLITFGDHALHHFFPTLDYGVLRHLYPVAEKTMKEFNLNIRMTSHLDMLGGYFRQMARTKPNPNAPNLYTKKQFMY